MLMMNLKTPPFRYLRTTEAARFLSLSPRTMEKHGLYGTGPQYRKLGDRVAYSIPELQESADQDVPHTFRLHWRSHPNQRPMATNAQGSEIGSATWRESRCQYVKIGEEAGTI